MTTNVLSLYNKQYLHGKHAKLTLASMSKLSHASAVTGSIQTPQYSLLCGNKYFINDVMHQCLFHLWYYYQYWYWMMYTYIYIYIYIYIYMAIYIYGPFSETVYQNHDISSDKSKWFKTSNMQAYSMVMFYCI